MTKKNTNIISQELNFTIDASLIERLGRELMAKAETAVAEIVKNAYDADATSVVVKFIDAKKKGGTLEVWDNGSGMTYDELVNGFLRISSDLKKKNPVSKIYKRTKAGNKGIGRFATQRLGSELIIETKSLKDNNGYKLKINWDSYKSGVDLNKPKIEIKPINTSFENGTKIQINKLRESWTQVKIKRIFRYLIDLNQTDYLSEQALNLQSNENKFEISCSANENGVEVELSSSLSLLKNSLATIEGKIEDNIGYVSIKSDRYKIDDKDEIVDSKIVLSDSTLKSPSIHFKAYYNINKYEYYKDYISKADFSLIRHYNTKKAGIRLYKNGFRLMPYGEKGNDWISIDSTNDIKTKEYAFVPFGSKNFVGFVEIIDVEEKHFKETSSREGLIENDNFEKLVEFINEALLYGAKRINSARFNNKWNESNEAYTETQNQADNNRESENISTQNNNDSLGLDLLHILATIGLSTGEFIHEIRQFVPAFKGGLKNLSSKKLDTESKNTLELLNQNFDRFKSYTAYIDNMLTKANDKKDLIALDILVKGFNTLMKDDLELNKIKFEIELIGYDLLTKPMYAAEWDSILYNLYSNSKKAIFRAEKEERKIKVVVGKSEDIVYLEFLDNGDGIPVKNHDRIFDAFFTTATKSESFTTTQFEFNGTGLGLKITKDIIFAYNGKILVAEAENQFSTNIRIELPAASEHEINEYYG